MRLTPRTKRARLFIVALAGLAWGMGCAGEEEETHFAGSGCSRGPSFHGGPDYTCLGRNCFDDYTGSLLP